MVFQAPSIVVSRVSAVGVTSILLVKEVQRGRFTGSEEKSLSQNVLFSSFLFSVSLLGTIMKQALFFSGGFFKVTICPISLLLFL